MWLKRMSIESGFQLCFIHIVWMMSMMRQIKKLVLFKNFWFFKTLYFIIITMIDNYSQLQQKSQIFLISNSS